MRRKLKKIIKALIPHGLVLMARRYREYRRLYKQESDESLVFDLVLSVGMTCRPAYYLKKHGLRPLASPLDWMRDYSLDTVAHLFRTRFSDFFLEFSYDAEKSSETVSWYDDCKNGMVSLHYDEIGVDNEAFRQMMQSRFDKIDELCHHAAAICFVSNRQESPECLSRFLLEMGEIYPCRISYINIRNAKTISEVSCPDVQRIKLSDRLELIDYDAYDIHPLEAYKGHSEEAWIGNYFIWDDVIGKLKLTGRPRLREYLFTKRREIV